MGGAKRKRGQDASNELYSNKSRAKPSVEARVDPTYGQRSALPGLDDHAIIDAYDDELDYGDDKDAISYLRAVRHEATGIPNLLVAPKDLASGDSRDIFEDGTGDYRGFYEDGAYCAAPQPTAQTSSTDEAEERVKDPQDADFNSILLRYENLRAQLQQTPPPEAAEQLDKDHPTYLGTLNTEIARWWRWKMRTVNPVAAQIASMDKSTVLRLLGLMTTGMLLKRGADVEMGVSLWAWGLLARLPGRGELTSEEIGVVRELGKKAVLVGMGLREEKNWEEGMDEVEAGFDYDNYDGETSVISEEGIQLDNDGFNDGESEEILGPDPANNSNRIQQIRPQLQRDDVTNESAIKENKADESTASISNVDDKEEGEHSYGEHTAATEDLAAAKARILEALKSGNAEEIVQDVQSGMIDEATEKKNSAKWNTRATVDMIITVAGEMYGQRDLLEFRESWRGIE